MCHANFLLKFRKFRQKNACAHVVKKKLILKYLSIKRHKQKEILFLNDRFVYACGYCSCAAMFFFFKKKKKKKKKKNNSYPVFEKKSEQMKEFRLELKIFNCLRLLQYICLKKNSKTIICGRQVSSQLSVTL